MIFNPSAPSVGGILLDIEGTTSPLRFVYQVLFPFARAHLRDYLSRKLDSEEVQRDLFMLREEHRADVTLGLAPPAWVDDSRDAQMESMERYVFWLMDRDRKSTGLKSLQGKVWRQGYLSGALKSEVFPDVPPALKYWKGKSLDVRIFSSGSVLAQKLFFTHTQVGDLSKFLQGYFDTAWGAKTSDESYRRIAGEFHLPPSGILFISDTLAELDAARQAGLATLLCVRTAALPRSEENGHRVIDNFSEIVGSLCFQL